MRTVKSHYIVRRREFHGFKTRGIYGEVPSYGPWRKLEWFDTLEEAQVRKAKEKIGLFDCGIFYRQRRVE